MQAKKVILTLIILSLSCLGFANEEEPDIDSIEAELTKKAPKPDNIQEKENTDSPSDKGKITELSKLVPFSEVSVIQKKFLPKTNRFQLNVGMNYLTNNPFYDTFGFVGKLAFYFTESIGLEISTISYSRSQRYITRDLRDVQNVYTSSLVTANSYLGLDLVYVPFYGKITWLDRRIISYDFFLSLGGGTTSLLGVSDPASTVHFGVGQIYAATKNFVIRWDLGLNSYQAQVPDISSSGSSTTKHVQNFNDIYLGVGMSFLFPGAKYR